MPESPRECRIIGSETELGGKVVPLAFLIPPEDQHRVLARAILRNQSQWYLDNGHLEIATPECLGPRENALYETASCALLAKNLSQYSMKSVIKQFRFYKNNRPTERRGRALVKISWGAHGNYLTYRDLDFHLLEWLLVPFLASRMPLIGNGWLDVGQDWSVRFLFSQRGDLIGEGKDKSLLSVTATDEVKAPINTRDRPYASRRWRRYHDITENSNMSEYQIWLKRGMMDLVLLLFEDSEFLKRIPASWHMRFKNANEAFRFFNRDMYTSFELADGRHMSALDIQEFYCDHVARFFIHDTDAFTDERREVLLFWRDTVDALRRKDRAYAERYLDWAAVSSYLINPAVARLGIEPGTTHQCDPFLDREAGMRARIIPSTVTIDTTRGKVRIISELLYRIVEYSNVETDASPYGILLKNGCMARLFTSDEIEHAMYEPPAGTRAACREELLRLVEKQKMSGTNSMFSVSWDYIQIASLNGQSHLFELPDPYRSFLTEHEKAVVAEHGKAVFGLANL